MNNNSNSNFNSNSISLKLTEFCFQPIDNVLFKNTIKTISHKDILSYSKTRSDLNDTTINNPLAGNIFFLDNVLLDDELDDYFS